MKLLPFKLLLKPNEVAAFSECEGAFIIEPMRFLWPSEAKQEAARPNYDQIAWCPDEYKPLYRSIRKKHVPASKARPMVEETIEADRRRSLNVLPWTMQKEG